MPTGYTYKVEEGTITEFPDFAMTCARAFGALINMRDMDNDVPIPEKIDEDTSYYVERLADVEQELIRLSLMTDYEVAKATEESFQSSYKSWEESLDNVRLKNKRYLDMLAKVKDWQPPTKDHVGLKDFMIEQLNTSMSDEKYYLDPPKKERPKAWLKRHIESTERNLEYYSEEILKAKKRASGNTKWVKDLRASLESYQTY